MSTEETKRVKISQDEQLEKIANIAAEKAALLVGKGILIEVKRIRETLESIERELREIKQAIARIEEEEKRKHVERGRRGDIITSILQESKYALVSEASRKLKIKPEELTRIASSEGVKVLNLGGDIALISESSYREFLKLLENLRTSDPSEAVSLLGEYGRLFDLLRRAGLVYYDYKRGGWVLIES